jgi:hypothetical protein
MSQKGEKLKLQKLILSVKGPAPLGTAMRTPTHRDLSSPRASISARKLLLLLYRKIQVIVLL